MNHDEARTAYSIRLDEDLDTETQAKLDDHFSSCEECRRYAADMSNAVGALGAAAPRPPAGLHAAIMAEVRLKPVAAAPARLSPWIFVPAAAAAAYFVYGLLSPAPAPKPDIARPQAPIPVRDEFNRKKPSPVLAGLAKRNVAFRAMPPHIVKPTLVFKGAPPAPAESPVFKIFAKAGVPAALRSDEHVRIFERLLGRREQIALLVGAGKILESENGLLAPKESGPPLKLVERDFVDEENADRGRLFEIDAEALTKKLSISKDEALEAVRMQFSGAN